MSPAAGPRLLETTSRRLEAALRTEQANGRLPSLVAGVVRDGSLVWGSSAGSVVNRDAGLHPTPQTQYRIGSITKTMTALLLMQLRDEGLVSLADPLERHVPGTPYGDHTLLQLISHASGMPAEPPGPWWERSPGVPWDDLAAGLRQEPPIGPAFGPDKQFHYSNLAFALLGEVVARRRGQPWAAVLQHRLLTPLRMSRTTYLPEPPAASGFSVHAFAQTLTDEPSHDAGALAPAGQIWSTVEDLAAYAAFLAEPDPAVIAPTTIAEMAVVRTGTPDDALSGAYGLGLRIAVSDDRTYLGHTGSMPGFLAGLFVDRERKTAAVCLANGFTGMRAQGLPLDLLQVLEEHEPTLPHTWEPNAPVDPSILEVLGLWHWGNTAFTMSYDGKALVAQILGDPEPWTTYRHDGDRFVGTSGYHLGEPLVVVRRSDGTIGHLECTTFIFTRTPYDPGAPIPGR